MTDVRQTKEYADYLSKIGWTIETIDNVYIFLKKIPLIGWFVKIQHPKNLNSKMLTFIEKKYHPLQFSIEPSSITQLSLLKNHNFKFSSFPSLPTQTLQLDLQKFSQELLKNLSQKTRYNIRLAQKKGVTINESKDITDFISFWRHHFEKKRFPFLSQKKNIAALYNSFGPKSHLLFAKKDNHTIAILFLIFESKVSYYMYAATSNTGRINFAPTLLTWTSILLAKKSGCTLFDFDGIYDARFPTKSWLGFTRFKKGFGGKEIDYPGRFVKNYLNNLGKFL